ncbi:MULTISPECIES: hypothetical protein [unclassified Clostridium]|uniref:hypothetical protein n=1 Tax=unclassified Clostridium TaxID=2614128 RepID=UPI0025C13151|nr:MULTISPECIES: hypothetical protein [unclassified Clostridium]
MIELVSYNLKLIEDTLNTVHPKQIINKAKDINFTFYKVNYEYTTNKGNIKDGEKYFLLDTLNPEVNMQQELQQWVIEYNNKNEHRQISNVKFLGSQCLGYINI